MLAVNYDITYSVSQLIPEVPYAEGKGYHRHFMGVEEPYSFIDIWQLLNDFKKDIINIRGRSWDDED